MKILHINWSGDLGGAEKIALLLAKYQKKLNNEVFIGYMNKKEILGIEAEKMGIRNIEFNMRNGLDIFRFNKYINFIRKEKFDVIHNHNGPPIIRVSKIFYKKAIFIDHIHGTKYGNKRWDKFYVILWKRLTSPFVDQFIANSIHTKNLAVRKEKIKNISVIYNGIEIEDFQPKKSKSEIKKELNVSDAQYIIGTVANLTPAKGIDNFIRVSKKVCSYLNNVKFIIVGDGVLRNKLENLAHSLGLKEKIIFTGKRTDIPDILNIFDIFLFTSNWEGFGISLIEAMAIGIPIISFAVDGVKEILDETCAVLIPPKDINKMAEETINLLRDKNKYQKLKISEKEKVQKFNIYLLTKKCLELYNKL